MFKKLFLLLLCTASSTQAQISSLNWVGGYLIGGFLAPIAIATTMTYVKPPFKLSRYEVIGTVGGLSMGSSVAAVTVGGGLRENNFSFGYRLLGTVLAGCFGTCYFLYHAHDGPLKDEDATIKAEEQKLIVYFGTLSMVLGLVGGALAEGWPLKEAVGTGCGCGCS